MNDAWMIACECVCLVVCDSVTRKWAKACKHNLHVKWNKKIISILRGRNKNSRRKQTKKSKKKNKTLRWFLSLLFWNFSKDETKHWLYTFRGSRSRICVLLNEFSFYSIICFNFFFFIWLKLNASCYLTSAIYPIFCFHSYIFFEFVGIKRKKREHNNIHTIQYIW